MAVNHDAYCFAPLIFTSTTIPVLEGLGSVDACRQLRVSGIQRFEDSKQVKRLASDYGGWDKASVLSQPPPRSPKDLGNIAFWLVLHLYGIVKISAPKAIEGLGQSWKSLDATLAASGWSDTDRSLLIRGRGFRELAERWFQSEGSTSKKKDLICDVFEHIRPQSVGGWAGWLDIPDVDALVEKLKAKEDDSNTLRKRSMGRGPNVSTVIDLALAMLSTAQKNKSGLCLILSG